MESGADFGPYLSGHQAPTGEQRDVGGAIPPLTSDLADGKTGG